MTDETDDVRISLVLPRDLLDAIDAVAERSERSRAGEIRRVLRAHVDHVLGGGADGRPRD